MSLSVVIACLNDPAITATCQSIRDTTTGKPVEIVVVDDMSPTPVAAYLKPEFGVNLIVNKHRCGVGPSRTIGVLNATGEYILICDAHMAFSPGWFDEAMRRIAGRPTTIHCATCIDMDRQECVYRGATMNVCGPDRQVKGKIQVLEGVWMPGDMPDDAELPAIMGACYFMPRAWFLKLNALAHLRSWGMDEPMLAIKSWLAAGDCRYLKNVRIAHKFWPKGKLPYRIPVADIIWNKLFAIHTLTPPDIAAKLEAKLQTCYPPSEWQLAQRDLKRDWRIVAQEQSYNRTIFRRDFYWYLRKFGLAIAS